MQQDKPLAELNDEALVGQCLNQNHDAFTELVDRYKNRVFWFVKRWVGEADAEDLTQEVFLRVYRALPSFRSNSKFSTWIYTIARNLCLSELRKRGSRGEQLSLDDQGEEKIHWLLPESQEGLAERIEKEDIAGKVRELVERLPVKYRTVLTLFYLNQVRYEEIAEIMELPLGTVKTYIHRGRLALRNLILEETDIFEVESGKWKVESEKDPSNVRQTDRSAPNMGNGEG